MQVPNWVRQRLRERYVRTGEGQSAFARRAIIRLLEEEDEGWAMLTAVLAFGYAGRKESLKLILATGLTMIGTAVAVIVVTALIVAAGA